jgi:hypothetical protein
VQIDRFVSKESTKQVQYTLMSRNLGSYLIEGADGPNFVFTGQLIIWHSEDGSM